MAAWASTRADVDQILATQRCHGIWENITLTHILALMALNELGGHQSAVDAGMERLLHARNPDGGIPFVTKADIFCTAICGLALAGAPCHDPAIGQLADYLASRQQPDGGWAYGTGATQTDVDDTAYSLEALDVIDPTGHRVAIQLGERYLMAIRNDDGGFPTYSRRAPSEPAMTAGALNALGPRQHQPSPIRESLHYLLDSQQPNGTFETSWSLSETNAIFRSVSALSTHNTQEHPLGQRIQRCFDRCRHRLAATQNPDGGWGQRPGQPSDPHQHLVRPHRDDHHRQEQSPHHRQRDLVPAAPATTARRIHLQTRHRGPRPIPHDLPVLASAFVLRAWNCVSSWRSGGGK